MAEMSKHKREEPLSDGFKSESEHETAAKLQLSLSQLKNDMMKEIKNLNPPKKE